VTLGAINKLDAVDKLDAAHSAAEVAAEVAADGLLPGGGWVLGCVVDANRTKPW
jgi:hypothetical protein